MKNTLILAINMLIFISNYAQRMDAYWINGYGNSAQPPNAPNWGGSTIVFDTSGITDMFPVYRNIDINGATAAIADNIGNLLFYSNGACIYNGFNELIPNSNIIDMDSNSPLPLSNLKDGYDSNPVFLPAVCDTNIYYMFYHSLKYIDDSVNNLKGYNLYCTTLDKRLNNGKGGIVQINQPIIQDTLDSQISFTKHANGRDWWLIVPTQRAAIYYQILITPNGVGVPQLLSISSFPNYFTVNCKSVFSKQGDKYARKDLINNLFHILNFDRCNGTFISAKTIPFSAISGPSIILSPNGNLLYSLEANSNNTNGGVFQYDITQTDIISTRNLIDWWDGFGGNFAGFSHFFLAPDNKIYINSNSTYLHVIHNPNNYSSCNLQQHSIQIPTISDPYGVPNYPNYYLGPLVGSGCDTLLSIKEQEIGNKEKVSIYPNPTDDKLTFAFGENLKTESSLYIRNTLGQIVYYLPLSEDAKTYTISLKNQAEGMYYYEVIEGNRISFTGKFIITH